MSGYHIGIIAEDESDVAVLKHFASKLTSRRFSVSKFTGKGCGPLKRKTPGWCKAFLEKGCSAIVLVHDRDRNKEDALRRDLEKIVADLKLQKMMFVVIPCEELEAWLLSDTKALKSAMNLASIPKQILHPETIDSPKEHLSKLVHAHSKLNSKRYVNSVHNLLIAKALKVTAISQRCPSFRHFESFVSSAMA